MNCNLCEVCHHFTVGRELGKCPNCQSQQVIAGRRLQCADAVFIDGKPFGQIHYWTRVAGFSGASVSLASNHPVTKIGGREFVVDHVFVAESDYPLFTFIPHTTVRAVS